MFTEFILKMNSSSLFPRVSLPVHGFYNKVNAYVFPLTASPQSLLSIVVATRVHAPPLHFEMLLSVFKDGFLIYKAAFSTLKYF